MEKPREFWVFRKPMESFEDGMAKHAAINWPALECIHTIEKSAYDQLLADARELQKALEKLDFINFKNTKISLNTKIFFFMPDKCKKH